MERSKNAMYAQAGKNRGWVKKLSEEPAMNIPAAPAVPVMPVKPMAPMENAVPVMPVKPMTPMENAVPVMPVKPMAPMENAVPVMPVKPMMPMENATYAPPVVIAPEMPKTHKTGESCQTLAMAYVAMQEWREVYEPEQGFGRGTLFAEMDLPFVGEGACKHG